MHPESDIARHFWVYVAIRAHGDSTGLYPWPILIAMKEQAEFDGAVDRGEITSSEGLPRPIHPLVYDRELTDDEAAFAQEIESLPNAWGAYYDDETGLPPRGFPTLQDALYDYLLAYIGLTDIDFKYDVWLRAVIHIVADAVREPDRLIVKVAKDRDDHSPTDEHVMTVSDDWSVLSRHTFRYVCRAWREVDERGGFQDSRVP
jgi:hypothetical protein